MFLYRSLDISDPSANLDRFDMSLESFTDIFGFADVDVELWMEDSSEEERSNGRSRIRIRE